MTDESSKNPKPCTYWACVGSGVLGLMSFGALGVLCCVDPRHTLKPQVIEVFQKKYKLEVDDGSTKEVAGVFCWGAMVEKYPEGKTTVYVSGENAHEKAEKKKKAFQNAFGRSVTTSEDEWNDVWTEHGSDIVEKCEAWKKEESEYKDRAGSDDDAIEDDADEDDAEHHADKEWKDLAVKLELDGGKMSSDPNTRLQQEFQLALLKMHYPTRFRLIFADFPKDRENILKDCNDFVERKAKYDKESYGFSTYLIVAAVGICALWFCCQFRKSYKEELEQQTFDDSDSDFDDFDAPDPVPVYFQPEQGGTQTGAQVQNPCLQNPPPVQSSASAPKPSEGSAIMV